MRLNLLIATAALACNAATAGVVEVSFADAARFTDAGWGELQTERTTRSLEDFLRRQGALLAEGRTLQITVTDVDLAGDLRQTPRGEVRVLRGGVDWPRIALRYELREGSRVIASGEETLSSMNYLGTPPTSARESDLPYEKRMLADWLHARFAPAAP